MYRQSLQSSSQINEALCVQNLLKSQEDMLWDMMRARQSQFTRENAYLQDQLLQLQQYQKRILKTQNENLIRERMTQQNLRQQEFIGIKNFNHQDQNFDQIYEQNQILKQHLANQAYLLSQQQEQIKTLQVKMDANFGSQQNRQQQAYEQQHRFNQASQQSPLLCEGIKNPQQMSSSQQLQGNSQKQAAFQRQINYQNTLREPLNGVVSDGNIYSPQGAQNMAQLATDRKKASQSAVNDTYQLYRYPSTNTMFENFETEQAIQEHNIIRQVQDLNKGSVDKKSQIHWNGENSRHLRFEGQETPERSNCSNQISQQKSSREMIAPKGNGAPNEQDLYNFQQQFNQNSQNASQIQRNQNYQKYFAPVQGVDTPFMN